MRALGWALVLWSWAVCGVAITTILHEWLRDRLAGRPSRGNPNVAWLWVMGTIRRVR